jgi:SAM-dependent methyltransferase
MSSAPSSVAAVASGMSTASSRDLVTGAIAQISPYVTERTDWIPGFVKDHTDRIVQDVDLLRTYSPPSASVLDVGALPLVFTLAAQSAGYRVTGLDLDPERLGNLSAHAGLDIRRCDVERERIPADDCSYDAIVFNEIFEHLRIDMIFTLSEVYRVLKPGGLLYLSTPNLRSMVGIANFLLVGRAYSCSARPYREYSKLRTIGHMGHVREYTPREVREFLEAIGFRVQKTIFRGTSGFALADAVGRIVPPLRSFVSVLASR